VGWKEVEEVYSEDCRVWGCVAKRLEAVQCALLLALAVGVVEGCHARLEMGAFGFDAETGVAFLFDSLEGVTRGAALFAHDIELFLKVADLLPTLVEIGLGLCVGGFKVGQCILEGSCQLLLSKQMLLNGANSSFLILN
jgi:hypothetical protein